METTQRQTYLDWLRIISIAGVLVLHSAMPYAAHLPWHIKNTETSSLLFFLVIFLHIFRMPLLFFISGTVSYYMMQRRTAMNFIQLRFTRLLIPLLIGIFIIVPPQIYIERINQGYTGNYWDFYKTVFNFKPYPAGGSFSWHHLWFIAYLFIYDLVFAPVFTWLISDKAKTVKLFLEWLSKDKRIYILAAPAIIWYILLSEQLPETGDLIHDGCFFVYYLFFVLAGFVCILKPDLMESLQRNRRISMSVGFTALLMFYYVILNTDVPPASAGLFDNPLHLFILTLKPITAWTFVFGLIGYGKQYLNAPRKILGYLNQAVYPFYILHQTVIVILAYYFTKASGDTIIIKYIFTFGVTFLITMGVFHFFIKPFAITRFLFGMKPDRKVKKTEEPMIIYNPQLNEVKF